jgi:hypothetical protein
MRVSYKECGKVECAHVDKLMNIFDVNFITTNSPDEIHEPQLFGRHDVSTL